MDWVATRHVYYATVEDADDARCAVCGESHSEEPNVSQLFFSFLAPSFVLRGLTETHSFLLPLTFFSTGYRIL